jgi:hypothetical protein
VSPSVSGEHLDADVIAAFAEGAVPQNVRMQYTAHLADCTRCRRILASVAVERPAEKAAVVPAALAAETAVPWYKALFATRNMALAMGSLALLFAVMIGYIALRQNDAGSASVSQVTSSSDRIEPPFAQTEASNSAPADAASSTNSNTAARNAAVPSAIAGASPVTVGNLSAAPAPEEESLSAAKTEDLPLAARSGSLLVGESSSSAKPAAAPPPPPAPVKSAETAADAVTAGTTAAAEKDENERKAMSLQRVAPAPSAKMRAAGSGPLQTQSNQVNNRNFDLPVTRSVGGKTFSNKESVWYDSAYTGQATTNVRRSTDEFNKLDAGLRSIANNLGGTVVVVWKSKAYRIQ